MPKLTFVVGSAGETRSVDVGDSSSIGSLPGSSIVLDASQGVSRRHCQILKISGGYEIADLGSTNGTKVNGQTIKKHKLAQGDRIEVGKAVLTWDDGSGGAAEEEISLEEPAGGGAAASSASAKSGGGASDQCVLVHAGGSDDGKKISLEKQRTTFGRNPKNAVVLTDSGASGFHAEISREGGAYVLRDLGSTNGTLVDGEPVSETALQHGARIRMGATRFVFVDPTVSDFEKAMAAVDDLGSEWGMLRAEMDMTRVQQARRSQIVIAISLLVVLGGGGAYVMTHLDEFSGKKSAVTDIAGNRVVDFSFEDRQGADWAASPGTPTQARAGDAKSEGKAKQGTAFYAVKRDGQLGACAAAQAGESSLIQVSPGHPVEFGAWVRATGGGAAGVRVVWLDGPKVIARSTTPLATGSEWTRVATGTAVPNEARAARIELLNAANGTAFFDDVFFVPESGAKGGVQVADGKVVVTITGDGQATIARDDAKLFAEGAVVGGALRIDSLTDQSRRGDRSGSQSISAAGASTSGTFVDPDTGEAKPFTIKFSALPGGRNVEIDATGLVGDAGWVATLDKEFFAGGIGVRSEGAGFRRAGEPHLFDKVLDVGFGGQHRFRVTKAEGCGPLRMALCRAGEQWEIAFGAADGNLKLIVDTDSNALEADIKQLQNEASSAKQQRRFGQAIAAFGKLASYYPEGSPEAQTISQEIKALEDEGGKLTADVEKRVDGGVEFRDENALRLARADAATVIKEYDGHELATRAKAADDKAAKALDGIHVALMELAAKPLLRKADDCANRKPAPQKDLARAYYNEIVLRFPGTEAEKKARAQLATLDPSNGPK